MRIIELRAENLKKLSAITIRPTDGLVQITGKNGNGKSSTLDALWWCLDGATHIQSQPIRKGADNASIRLELGTPGQPPELIATRTFASKEDGGFTTSIKVESAEGAAFPRPQAVLDKLLGELAFDPLEFTRLKPREQYDALISFVPGLDVDKITAANAVDFDKRRDINRQVKDLRGAAELIPPLPEGFDPESADVEGLTARLAGASAHNTQIATRKANRVKVSEAVARMRDEANRLAESSQALQEQAKRQEDESRVLLEKAEAENKRLASAPALPAEIDTTALMQEIAAARAGEELVRRDAERTVKLRQAAELEKRADQLTEVMELRLNQAQAAIEASKLPVEGLGFGKGEITLRGVPFNQASDAEQLRTSIAIAMAKNPKLRVLRIRDGSLLDDDSLKVLEGMLEEHDYQCWLERVDSSGTVGFVLEDGHLKGAPTATTTPEAAKAVPATRKKAPARAAPVAPAEPVEAVAPPPPEPVGVPGWTESEL